MLFRGVEVPARGGTSARYPPAPPCAHAPCPMFFLDIVGLGMGHGVGGHGRPPVVAAARGGRTRARREGLRAELSPCGFLPHAVG